ncbi:LacI family DNA-binding transcriptional regulator [Nonomuraea soli]|uniref:DNA-binding LacI/PurR family transcriptional regulator n=1 Tax=Nonomuraea soli TaxID=1032476 RepID=A0A7W0HSI6_9ACTN|nr:LacI family DNA-binding transcriptional regulator [Nonomuraea soli]MBA2894113.1 DNA-binding LacI/PurR family transcriptional regulator [Nonomuraea soli]
MPARRARGVSIEDVARAAGVSRQTVSNAINAPQRLRPETLDRVTELIREMGYSPDQSARSLRSGTRRIIAYTTPETDPANPNALMSGFLEALVAASGEVGYRILLVRPRPGQPQEKAIDEVIAGGGADAFLLSDVLDGDTRVEHLAAGGFPFAVFGRTGAGLPQSWVDLDSARAMADLVGLLAGRGHRHVGLLTMSLDQPWLRHRAEGFRAGVRGHGLTCVEATADDPESAVAAGRELLGGRPAPTALVVIDDWLAPAAYAAAQAEGLVVGADLAVAGFNDMPYAALLQPPLTTLRLPLRRIADALVGRLLTIIDDGVTPETGLLLPGEIVVRASLP